MRPIPGFNGYYATENGHIWSERANKFLSEHSNAGYLRVTLYKNAKPTNMTVHRLVALAFIPNPDMLPCINHKDENKQNNRVDNLEWCTYQYNNHYGKGQPTQKAAAARRKAVVQINSEGKCVAEFLSVADAGRTTGICPMNIANVCCGRLKTAGGYIWKYVGGK